MSVSYNGSSVSVGSYKSGTTQSASTTTLEVLDGDIASGDVGRLVLVKPDAADASTWEVRQITGVSAGTISIHDDWTTEIPSGTTWRVAHTLEDVHALAQAGLNKIGKYTYQWDGDWSISSTGFLGDTDVALEMTTGNDPAWSMAAGGVVQFGILWGGEGSGFETTNGCRLSFEGTSSGMNMYTTDNGRVADGAVTNYYGCLVESIHNPGYVFGRMNGPARFIGSVFDGQMGGRFYHEASEWVQCRMSGNDDPVPAWSIGATFTRPISRIESYRNLFAMKNYLDFGGTFRDVTFSNNGDILNRGADSGSVMEFIDCTEFGSADVDGTGGYVHQSRSVNVKTTDNTGADLGGVAFRVNNVDDATEGSVQTSAADGSLSEVIARRFTMANGSSTNQSFAPFRIRYRKYGYLWQSVSAPISAPIDQSVAIAPDDAVTQSESTAQGHAGITVTDHGGTPVSWNGLNWGISVEVDTAQGATADDIRHYLHYHLSQTVAFEGKTTGLHWHEFVPAMGRETQRGDYGGTLKGVRIVDLSGNPIPGFDRFQSDDGTYYTVPSTFGIEITGLESGSQVKIFEAGTTTIVSSTANSGTSFSYSEEGTPYDVDYTVIQAGYRPIRVTWVSLQADTILSQGVNMILDRAYQVSSGLTFGTDFTVDTGTKTLTLSTPSTWRNFYSALVESWRDQATLENMEFEFVADGTTSFTLQNGWEFSGSTDISNLSQGGHRYLDGTGAETAVWAGLESLGDTSSASLAYQQVLGTTTSFGVGPVDDLIQVYGDSTHGSFDYRGKMTFKVLDSAYQDVEYDFNLDGNVSNLRDTQYAFPLAQEDSNVPAGDPAITGVTITDHGGTPVSWDAGDGAKDYSITIEDTGSNTGSDILQWIIYNKAQLGSFEGKEAFHWPRMVKTSNGVDFESVRGRVWGGTGPLLKGVRVIDGVGDPHPDFTRFQADDGTYGTPPTIATASVTNIVSGSRIQVYNVTTSTEVANEIVSATEWNLNYTAGTTFSDGDTVRVRLTHQDGTTANEPFEGNTVAGTTGWSVIADQPSDTVYNQYGIDGSTVTDFIWDGTNIEIDVDTSTNLWEAKRMFAWFCYFQTTEVGIRDVFGLIVAIDVGNIELRGTTYLDNIRATTAKQSDNIRVYRSDDALPVINPTSGGGGLTFFATGNVYLAESGTSGLTASESNQLSEILTVSKLTGNKVTASGDIITIYEADGTTVWREYDLSNGGRVEV